MLPMCEALSSALSNPPGNALVGHVLISLGQKEHELMRLYKMDMRSKIHKFLTIWRHHGLTLLKGLTMRIIRR